MSRIVAGTTDLLLAACPPALVAASALLELTGSDSPAAFYQGVATLMFVPVAACLPVTVYFWLRRTGLPTPGQMLTRKPATRRTGGPLGDALLIIAAAFASLPLFYTYPLIPDEAVSGALTIATPAAMTVGTLITLRRTRSRKATHAEHVTTP